LGARARAARRRRPAGRRPRAGERPPDDAPLRAPRPFLVRDRGARRGHRRARGRPPVPLDLRDAVPDPLRRRRPARALRGRRERWGGGVSAARAARCGARVTMRDASGDRGEVGATIDVADPPAGWTDLWLERRDDGTARAASDRTPGTIELEIASDGPAERA